MTRFVTFAVVLLVAATAAAQTTPAQKAPAPTPKAFAPLQGTWVLTGPEGQPLMPDGELACVNTGDKYAQTVNGEVNETGTIKLDPATKPMAIDLIIADGQDGGKTQLGVIEVTGDTLKGALSVPGETLRPTGFAAGEGIIAFVGKKKGK
ncbi:TIGR03067 domain-containing protein [bacterium]|nr:MAG: TIGR03067 domain-containing protein [bacterium]